MPSPTRKQPPSRLAGAIAIDMERHGDPSLPVWAKRRHVPLRTAEGWAQGRGTGHMARLLAELLA